jgi:uncharacterized protein GlcG (DUF336 family)
MPVSYDEALRMIQAAHERARQLGIRVTAVVVDEGGLLQGLGRMTGAPPLSAQIAESKAVGAALWHREGASLAEVNQQRPAFFQAVAQLVRVPIIPGLGSALIRRDAAILGAIGVSGGKPEQDLDCAEHGLRSLSV